MAELSTTSQRPAGDVLIATLGGGFVAGILDISYAIIAYSFQMIGPDRVLQGVASGLLGRQAYAGGAGTALLGLALHFLMTTAMALAYVVAARRVAPILHRRWILLGAVYGALLFVVMNGIVVPLSAAYPKPDFTVPFFLETLAVHIVLVGLPIAFISAWSLRIDRDLG